MSGQKGLVGNSFDGGKKWKWSRVKGFEKSDFGQILQKNLIGTPFQFQPDPYPHQNLFYRSDNATLARLSVPAHSISTDEIDIDKFYHTVNDEVETLDINNFHFWNTILMSWTMITLRCRKILHCAAQYARI